MNRSEAESFKRQLYAFKKVAEVVLRTTTDLISQIDGDSNPDHRKTARSVPEFVRYDSKRILIDSGFFSVEEAEDQKAIGLYNTVNKYSGIISEDTFRKMVNEVIEKEKKGTVNNKIGLLIHMVKSYE